MSSLFFVVIIGSCFMCLLSCLDRRKARTGFLVISGKCSIHFLDNSSTPSPFWHEATNLRTPPAHWFINNFRFFGGGFREVVFAVLTCFSGSSLSIFQINVRSQIPSYYYQTLLRSNFNSRAVNSRAIFGFFGHNSKPRGPFGVLLGGNSSHRPPGPV